LTQNEELLLRRVNLPVSSDYTSLSAGHEVAEKLQTRWELAPGAVFNASYVKTFLERNGSLLPGDFTQSDDVELFTDCRDATVAVYFHLMQGPHLALDRTKHVDCPPPAEKRKKQRSNESTIGWGSSGDGSDHNRRSPQ
jgi:hypothetical protein